MHKNSSPTGDPEAHRSAVQRRLAALESEVAQLRQELAGLGREQVLQGLFLTVEVAGALALLPTEAVQEVVRLVELSPLPAAPEHVAGTFLYRGAPAVVVDLAVLLGVRREPELDAHLVVCGGARPVALLVDRVRDIVEQPTLVDAAAEGERTAWDRTGLMAGLCRTPAGLVPLLRASTVLFVPASGGAVQEGV
ncbi:chemotaxis protein CheW [Aggregicoccus sp. 17bor-14]|uniref:chemotaxis protein CheW n=1 Tax=Myxococcaceae TaxID=31 RepID=UPI00129C55CA|nr:MULTISPECIES: chemotaxis protein CheW [Myxococcaceae]MBF5041411.1 chemotaxis protein CheW [Simulacricoccus sp. 17bor-14]MRI87195.1 chemotaxis protein CheW [Aggregicoccus sp. 17bor-14]